MEEALFKTINKLLKMIRLFIGFLLIFLICMFVKKFSVLKIFTQIFVAFLPLILGFFIAYLLEPTVKKLEKKLPKFIAITLPFLLFFISFFLFLLFIVPPVLKEGSQLFHKIPLVLKKSKKFLSKQPIFKKNTFLKTEIFKLFDEIPKEGSKFLRKSFPLICHSCLDCLITFFFSILLAIYLLVDFKKIKKSLFKMIPIGYQSDVKSLFYKLRKSLLHYFKGVLLVMFFVFITQAIGFSLSGVKSPLFFAILCAITDFIPFIGPYIGGIPAIIVASSMSNQVGFLTLLSIVLVQILENTFYQPYILGKTLILPSWLILISISVLSTFFGFLGLVLATPILVVLKVLLPYLKKWYPKKSVNSCPNT